MTEADGQAICSRPGREWKLPAAIVFFFYFILGEVGQLGWLASAADFSG